MVKNDEDDGILTIAAYETMPTISQKGSLTPPPSKKYSSSESRSTPTFNCSAQSSAETFPSVHGFQVSHIIYHTGNERIICFTNGSRKFILPTSEWEGWYFFLLGEPADFYNLVMPAFLWQTKLPSAEEGIRYNIAQCSFSFLHHPLVYTRKISRVSHEI